MSALKLIIKLNYYEYGYNPTWKECRTYCLGVLERAEASLTPEELKNFKEYRRKFR
ncbi:MAG: hypothetical protein IJ545_02750 [Alphaproteobacteria bacterium]|nr:hypothetical protein [Alphaproteobacteria bacterium]